MPFLPMLDAWQWWILGCVPPAIAALYFLKLKRRPVEVPSTLLWKQAIEDLHVNSFWQRMRRSLLLYLQILFVLFVIFTLLRPNWETQVALDERVIILIDNSASMSATDVAPTRLAVAKERAREILQDLDGDAVAMLISFADGARVEKSFTGNRVELLEAVDRIQPTEHTTNALEALRQAAGLANPGAGAAGGEQDADEQALPSTLYILSDGKFPSVPNFTLGNLKPIFLPIGVKEPENVGITAFSVRRKDDKADEMQAFARLENASATERVVKAELLRDDRFWDSTTVTIAPRSSQSAVFDLRDIASGTLELRLTNSDQLALDDRAYAVIQEPAPLRVLLVTAGNADLKRALSTIQSSKLADVRTQKPEYLEGTDYQKGAAGGGWDLIVYDRCRPKEMPRANTVFWGDAPPIGWTGDKTVGAPQVIDVDRTHPLSANLDFDEVLIDQTRIFEPPKGTHRLVETTKGLLIGIAPRDSFEDVVIGFPIYMPDKAGKTIYNTNFPLRPAFPLLMQNLLGYFGRTIDVGETTTLKPGQEIELRKKASIA
ncbi:MAG: BatA and WFA domain-containing protein [Pirellulales bacterium]